MRPIDLTGKTIKDAKMMKNPKYDDEDILRITFSDGEVCYFVATYG
jgi:hypothetical protein